MFLGADTAALRETAEGFHAGAVRLGDQLDVITSTAGAVPWEGPDRDAFLEAVARLRRDGEDVISRIEDCRRRLQDQAEHQDAASDADGAFPDIGSLRAALAQAQDSGVIDDVLRRLFGASGDSTSGSLGGFEDPDHVNSRSIGVDLESMENFDPSTMVQGDTFGDCWFIATLGAVADQNPELIAQNIRLVEGESPAEDYWVVTLYEDGEPVEHTVTQDELVRDGVRERVDFADGSYREQISWMSIYERAAVEHVGGDYGDLEANFAGNGFEMITGDDGDIHFTGDFDDIEADLAAGQPMVTSTAPDWLLGGPVSGDVVPGHVYVVEGISTNADGVEVITLVNPWGTPDGSKPPTLELTQEEYLANFVSRNTVDP